MSIPHDRAASSMEMSSGNSRVVPLMVALIIISDEHKVLDCLYLISHRPAELFVI